MLNQYIFLALSIWVAHLAETVFSEKDPQIVVIDEIAGLLVAMAAVPLRPGYVVAGVVLFRLFDIMKPFPANRINDRMTGGAGIVLDDVVAGVYANLVLQAARLLLA